MEFTHKSRNLKKSLCKNRFSEALCCKKIVLGIVLLPIFLSIIPLIQAYSVWDNLTLYYDFDRSSGTNVPDIVNSAFNGTTVNMTNANWVSGKISNGLNFTGHTYNEYINISNTSMHSGANNPISISVWVKPAWPDGQIGGTNRFISSFKHPSGQNLFYFRQGGAGSTEEHLWFGFRGTDKGVYWNLSENYTDIFYDQWVYLVVTHNGSDDKTHPDAYNLYVNGDLFTTGKTTQSAGGSNSLSYMGIDSDKDSSEFNGTIDEFALFNKTLNSSDVTRLYNSGAGLSYNPKYFIENSQTFNATTYETNTESFTINITYESDEWDAISAKLNYNNTNYTGTQVGTGDTITFTKELDIPSLSGVSSVNMPFFWFITLTNSTANYAYESNHYNQTVNPVNFTLCNSTQTPFLNFTIHNAENPFPVMNGTFKSSWRITTGSGDTLINESFEDTSEGNSTFAFCFLDEDENYTISATIEIDADGYAKNFHYLTDLPISNTTSNINLYLLNDSKATLTELEVVNEAQNPLADTYISIQMYDIGTDTFYTVSMAKTSSEGVDLSYLNWYDTLYKFVLVRGGSTIKTTSSYKISETPQTFEVVTETIDEYLKFQDFSYSLYFNDSTNNFVLTFTKPSGDVDKGCLRVDKINISGETNICTTCETSSSATVYCNIAGYGNGTYVAVFYATGSYFVADSIIQIIGAVSDVYPLLGNLEATALTIIFVGIVFAMFLVSPVMGVIGVLLGMVGAFALGFQPLGSADDANYLMAIIGIMILGGAVIWFTKR